MTALEDIRRKIEWAEDHIRHLEDVRVGFLNTHPYKVVPHFHAEEGATAYVVEKCPPVHRDIPMIAGDAIHNLRASLDYLAVALGEKLGARTRDRIQFPVFDSRANYDANPTGKKPNRLLTISGGQLKKIFDAVKPYRGGNDDLWVLHKLDIFDKHHQIIAFATVASKIGFGIDQAYIESLPVGPFKLKLPKGTIPRQTLWFPAVRMKAPEEGAELFRMPGDHETYNRVDLAFDIALGEPELIAGQPIGSTLLRLANTVKGVVNRFEKLLV